jgi:hypothetical protein
VAGQQVGALGGRLRDVQVQQQPVLPGRRRRVAQHGQRHGVRRVRSYPELDRAVARRRGGQVDGGAQLLLDGGHARQRKQRRGDHRPRAGGADRGGDPLGVEVHLDAGGHPVAQQLRRGRGHGHLDVLGREPGLPRPHDLAQPPVQRQPFALAAEQHHRRVRVGVDQPGRQHSGELHPDGVPRLGCLGGRADPGDPPVLDVQGGVRDDGAGPVPHHDRPGEESLPHGSRTYTDRTASV